MIAAAHNAQTSGGISGCYL